MSLTAWFQLAAIVTPQEIGNPALAARWSMVEDCLRSTLNAGATECCAARLRRINGYPAFLVGENLNKACIFKFLLRPMGAVIFEWIEFNMLCDEAFRG